MAADPIDERYDEIVRGLRALPGAPAELRGRVLAFALVVVAAVAAISLTSGSPRSGHKVSGQAASSAGGGTFHRVELAPVLGKRNAPSVGLPISPAASPRCTRRCGCASRASIAC